MKTMKCWVGNGAGSQFEVKGNISIDVIIEMARAGMAAEDILLKFT